MKMLLVAAMVLVAAGCGVQGLQSVKGQKVYVGSGVPTEAVAEALNDWNSAVGIDLTMTADPRESDITVVATTDGICGPHLGYEDDWTTQAAVCVSIIDDRRWLAVVIEHELGHVMGLHHIPGPALMFHVVGADAAIGEGDIAEFRARWGSP